MSTTDAIGNTSYIIVKSGHARGSRPGREASADIFDAPAEPVGCLSFVFFSVGSCAKLITS
jgi:hypothetical protein